MTAVANGAVALTPASTACPDHCVLVDVFRAGTFFGTSMLCQLFRLRKSLKFHVVSIYRGNFIDMTPLMRWSVEEGESECIPVVGCWASDMPGRLPRIEEVMRVCEGNLIEKEEVGGVLEALKKDQL